MQQWIKNVYFLCGKEIRSFFSDFTLLILVIMMFTVTIYSIAKGITTEVKNVSVAILNEDRSALSFHIQDAMLPPQFNKVVEIKPQQIDTAMDNGEYIFVLTIPANFTADLLANKQPELQLLVDATAMSQAAVGASYLQQIIRQQIVEYLNKAPIDYDLITPKINVLFNSNLKTEWYMPVTQITGNSTLLTLILVGAAVIREREHGTIEHLLVMPVSASEIVISKILANGLIILIAAFLSLYFVVHKFIDVPINGSIGLFIATEAVFLSSMAGLGIYLATHAPTMPQFSLLCLPVYIVLYLLSGSLSPLENMPLLVQYIMQLSPLTQFIAIGQDVLFRGAGMNVIWPRVLIITLMGALFILIAILRFRIMLARQN
ncbi:ABC transporter permease [Pasteurella canis]|uniref:ABC transporter permease n=1 Tax=Pasteurella canis TaxID=753 RepID=UPI001D10E373|nr:ABC transporter permease [Pasteurella canis]UDW83042.1 ABC transporter permease [Pasteurella canis]